MAQIAEVWAEALPVVKNSVTGVGIWAALNTAKPIALENGFVVLGVPGQMAELAGHLRMPQIRKLIETEVAQRTGGSVELRVIEGTEIEDWERVKRRDIEAKRLQEAALNRARAEVSSRTNWDTIYETLSRKYAAIPNKTMPQNRAKFYLEAIQILVDARNDKDARDDNAERNFARCLERVSQYSEVPGTVVALDVLRLTGGN